MDDFAIFPDYLKEASNQKHKSDVQDPKGGNERATSNRQLASLPHRPKSLRDDQQKNERDLHEQPTMRTDQEESVKAKKASKKDNETTHKGLFALSEATTWDSLGLAGWMEQTLQKVKLTQPTAIQSNVIPPILAGRNTIACSPTGSGKTAAFAIPILQKLAIDPFGVFGLVISPTRELASQIYDQFLSLGFLIRVRVSLVVGGHTRIKEGNQLNEKPHIIVATPGRLIDHMKADNIKFPHLRFLVLDEADRLLAPGTDLNVATSWLLVHIPPRKDLQMLLFSATMNHVDKRIKEIPAMQGTEPFIYNFGDHDLKKVNLLDEKFVLVPDRVKECYLMYLLRLEEKALEDRKQKAEEEEDILVQKKRLSRPDVSITSTIVFVETVYRAQLFHLMLEKLGIRNVCLHSGLKQDERTKALQKFKSSWVRVLIATDVAARGLDIPEVDLVINYDLPASAQIYTHRVGRTARAGRSGRAISFVTQFSAEHFLKLENKLRRKIQEHKLEEKLVLRHLNEVTTAQVVIARHLKDSKFEENVEKKKRAFTSYSDNLLEEFSDPALNHLPAKAKPASFQRDPNKNQADPQHSPPLQDPVVKKKVGAPTPEPKKLPAKKLKAESPIAQKDSTKRRSSKGKVFSG